MCSIARGIEREYRCMSCEARKSNIFGLSQNIMIQSYFLREIIKPPLKRVHKVDRPIDVDKMINLIRFNSTIR